MAGPMAAPEDGGSPRVQRRSSLVLTIGDFIVTALWVMASSCFAEVAEYLAKCTGLDELVLGIGVLVAALTLIGPLCGAFGGALFNPVNSIALISSGKGGVAAHVVRMCGQLAGALVGTLAAKWYLPEYLQGKFHTLSGGIKEGVAFEMGFACEGTLSLLLNYVFLLSIDADSQLLTTWVPMLSTVLMSWVGYYVTGPSLNPFVSFSWHLHYKRQDQLEHLLVFWSAPILGAVAAGLVYYLTHRPASTRKHRRPSRAAIAARNLKTQQQQEQQQGHHHSHRHHGKGQ